MSAALVRSVWARTIPHALQRGVLGALAAWADDDGTFHHPPTVAALVAHTYPGGRRLGVRIVQYQLRVLERFGVLVVAAPARGRGHARVYRLVPAALAGLSPTAVAAAGFRTATTARKGALSGGEVVPGKGAQKDALSHTERVHFGLAKGAHSGRSVDVQDPIQSESTALLDCYRTAWSARYHTPADVTARDRAKAADLVGFLPLDRLCAAVAAYVESHGYYADRGHPFALFAANAGILVARQQPPPPPVAVPTRPDPLPGHLTRLRAAVVARLDPARPALPPPLCAHLHALADDLTRLRSDADVRDQLAALDAALVATAHAAAPIATLRAEVDAELQAFRWAMPEGAYRSAEAAGLTRAVRGYFALPVVTM